MASGDTATDSTASDAPVVDNANTSLKREENSLDKNGTVTTRCTTTDPTALEAPVVDNANTSPKREENYLDNDAVTARCSSSSSPIDSFPSSKKKSAISFGSVKIRTHNLILGDNPAVSQGLPLALAWDHEESMSFSFDDFEEIRETRPKRPLRISGVDREAWLQEIGHTDGSFSRVSEEIYEIKSSRQQVKQEIKKERKQQFALLEYQALASVSLREHRRKSREVSRAEIEQLINDTESKAKIGANQEDSKNRRRRRLFGGRRWMKK
jgi:hypothetical protein